MNKLLLKTCILSILIASCKLKNTPDHFGVITNPGVAAPLVDVDLKLRDVVNSQAVIPQLSEGSDKVYVITYKDTIFTDTISKYITLNDQSFSNSFQLPSSEVLIYNTGVPRNYSDSLNQEVDFTVAQADQKLTKVIFKSGVFQLNLNSDFPYDVTFNISFPDVINTTTHKALFYPPIQVPANGKNIAKTLNLAGYEADLTASNTAQNKFRYKISYTVLKQTPSGPQITPLNNNIQFDGFLKDLRYSYLEGYLGEITLPDVNSFVQVQLFKNVVDGKVSFTEPSVTLSFDNSAGINADVHVNPLKIKFAKRVGDSVITRNHSNSFLDTTVAGALITAPNSPALTDITWNVNNSNIATAFQPSPFDVYYNANVVLNKNVVGAPTLKNFITDQSMVRIRASVALPIVGTLYYLTIADTVDMPANNGLTSIDFDFDSATFKLNVTNGFPIDCQVQAYFMDSLHIVRDSLIKDFTKSILPSAVVDLDGTILSKTRQYYQRSFTKAQYDKNIKNTRYILVVGHLHSYKSDATVPQSVKIFADNTLEVKLSGEVRAKIHASTND